MAKPKRELLKFRPGDCGLKIKKDGSIEVAGVDEAGGMIDKKGMVNPALLFASAWARKDQKVFQVLLDNFKESVREGYFGEEAKKDYKNLNDLKIISKYRLEAQRRININNGNVAFFKTHSANIFIDKFEVYIHINNLQNSDL